MDYKTFLTDKGYKDFGQTHGDHYELFQKKVDVGLTDDRDNKLYIDIKAYRIANYEGVHHQFNVEITLEKNKLWWCLKAYSLLEKELKTRLDEIEKQLVEFLNSFK